MLRDGKLRLTVETRPGVNALSTSCCCTISGGRCLHGNGNDALELLLGKQVLPVLVLTLELLVCALHGSLLLLQLANNFLEAFKLLALFHSASHCTLAILEAPKDNERLRLAKHVQIRLSSIP